MRDLVSRSTTDNINCVFDVSEVLRWLVFPTVPLNGDHESWAQGWPIYNLYDRSTGVPTTTAHVPELPAPVRSHRGERTVPSAKDVLRFEGNTAHSAGWWWASAGQICMIALLIALLIAP